jgi:hypothetical protein
MQQIGNNNVKNNISIFNFIKFTSVAKSYKHFTSVTYGRSLVKILVDNYCLRCYTHKLRPYFF